MRWLHPLDWTKILESAYWMNDQAEHSGTECILIKNTSRQVSTRNEWGGSSYRDDGVGGGMGSDRCGGFFAQENFTEKTELS